MTVSQPAAKDLSCLPNLSLFNLPPCLIEQPLIHVFLQVPYKNGGLGAFFRSKLVILHGPEVVGNIAVLDGVGLDQVHEFRFASPSTRKILLIGRPTPTHVFLLSLYYLIKIVTITQFPLFVPIERKDLQLRNFFLVGKLANHLWFD